MRILVMGLSGTGKTTLCRHLIEHLDADYINADEVRGAANDWDFSAEGRERQANRMIKLSYEGTKAYMVADFICPRKAAQTAFNADFTIWMDTEQSSGYADTDAIFEKPEADVVVTSKDKEYWTTHIISELGYRFAHNAQHDAPTRTGGPLQRPVFVNLP
jgi:adenylylsulfate kinase